MEGWDAQMMLDEYIRDYMMKNNMYEAAYIFTEEANICDRPVVIDSKEGFLAEWWSLFWDVYSNVLSKRPTATEGYTSKNSFQDNCRATQNAGNGPQNIPLETPRPDMKYMFQNISAAMGMLGLSNQPQTVHLTARPSPHMVNLHQSTPPVMVNLHQSSPPMTMPGPAMVNFLQSALPITTQRPELNPCCLGSPPLVDFDTREGDFLTNLMAASVHEQEHLMFPERVPDFNSQLLSVDQLARRAPSSSKYSYPVEIVPHKHQCDIFGVNHELEIIGFISVMSKHRRCLAKFNQEDFELITFI
ncbi:hypothetical protein F511_03030 [Dorcoceras hygrometricum]|nr:hypothetical protein F511_03030 [Dorcoceras hygrometricum]